MLGRQQLYQNEFRYNLLSTELHREQGALRIV